MNFAIITLVFRVQEKEKIGFVYSLIYLTLSLIDCLASVAIIRKIKVYQKMIRLYPGGQPGNMDGVELIKWILVVVLLLYFFVSAQFYINFEAFLKIFTYHFTTYTLLIWSCVYCVMGVFHIFSLELFKRRQKYIYQIQMN